MQTEIRASRTDVPFRCYAASYRRRGRTATGARVAGDAATGRPSLSRLPRRDPPRQSLPCLRGTPPLGGLGPPPARPGSPATPPVRTAALLRGRSTTSSVVRNGGGDDEGNLQSLCRACH